MIRVWVSPEKFHPLHDQIGRQIRLGIASGELAAGSRLPSVRAMARILGVHPNTVSRAYRDLAQHGWLTAKRGSGVFVALENDAGAGIEAFTRAWLEEARLRNFSASDLMEALQRMRKPANAAGFVVVDADPDLARILASEIEERTGHTVRFSGCAEAKAYVADGLQLLAQKGSLRRVREAAQFAPLIEIELNSMPELLATVHRPAAIPLVAIVSPSASVRSWALALLPAVGVAAEQLVSRDPAEADWRDGLAACAVIAADVTAAQRLAGCQRVHIFRLIRERSLSHIEGLVAAAKLS